MTLRENAGLGRVDGDWLIRCTRRSGLLPTPPQIVSPVPGAALSMGSNVDERSFLRHLVYRDVKPMFTYFK